MKNLVNADVAPQPTGTPARCWCPYLGEELNADQTSKEHVIPLALGGSDSFVIRADKEMNSTLGSAIDGALANEFPTAIRRVHFNARGHTGAPPVARLKKTKRLSNDDPLQIAFSKEKVEVWDAKKQRAIDTTELGDATFSSTFTINRFSRIRFMSKVALASGHFIYGNAFRTSFRHEELRATMRLEKFDPGIFSHFRLRLYDEFSSIDPLDARQTMLDKNFCGSINGSCVMVIPGPSSVGFVVGILGHWIGTLNVPANTNDLPIEDDHDLGHVVRIDAGKMRRLSYRQLAAETLAALGPNRQPTPG